MNNVTKVIVAIVAVIVVAGGAIFLLMPSKKSDTSQPSSQSNNEPATLTITYDGNAFSPSSVTIKSGGTIKIVNQSQSELSFDSDPHPVHTDNTELNIGEVAPGSNKTFTVTTKGSWGYHNHDNPTQHGTIIVE